MVLACPPTVCSPLTSSEVEQAVPNSALRASALTVKAFWTHHYSFKTAVLIGGVPVDAESAAQWERLGLLPAGTVAAAPIVATRGFEG